MVCVVYSIVIDNFDGLVQERHNSIALAKELCLPSTNPLIYSGNGLLSVWCQAIYWASADLLSVV